MSGTGYLATSRRIQAEKSLKHLGAAWVALDVLRFPSSSGLDLEKVERLKRLFRGERGCLPSDRPNRIPAIIDEAQLTEALHATGIAATELMLEGAEPPELTFPVGTQLECLQGRHRAWAASQVLIPRERRWVVELFAADLSEEAKQDLIDGYANEKTPSDGEFYYKIREYQGVFGQKNPYFERRWRARLASESRDKEARLRQLDGHHELQSAFDAFRPLRALYLGLRLSMINKILSMRCPEEVLSSLKHVKDVFYLLFDGDEEAMGRLAPTDVQALQQKAPGVCKADADELYGRIRSGEILGGFRQQERVLLWERLCRATEDYVVPSLYGFFENLKYLEDAAACMRKPVDLEGQESVRSAYERCFSPTELPAEDTCSLQVSATSFKSVPAGGADRFDLAYRQLWLFARREHEDMPSEPRKKLSGPKGEQADESVKFEFAFFAHWLGFRSNKITSILQQDPDRERARRFLTTARRPDQYTYNNLEDCVNRVVAVVQTARPIESDEAMEEVVVDDLKPPRRSGKPHALDQSRDKAFLFLDKLHAPVARQCEQLSSFFVQRSTYFTFFGIDLGVDVSSLAQVPESRLPNGRDLFLNAPRAEQRPERPEQPDQPDQPGEQSEGRWIERRHLARLEQLTGEEQEQQARLECLRQEGEEWVTRFEAVAQEEQAKRREIQQLQSTAATEEARIRSIHDKGQAAQGRLAHLEREEKRQQDRLKERKAEEEAQRRRIDELLQTQQSLGEEVQTGLIAAERRNQAAKEEREQRSRLEQLSEEEQALQNSLERLRARETEQTANLDKLATQERDMHTRTKRLQQEEESLQRTLEQLRTQSSRFAEEEQAWTAKLASLLARESDHQSIVHRLVAKELEHRTEIDKLALCIEMHKEEAVRAEKDERERQSRIERLGVHEKECRLAVDRLEARIRDAQAQLSGLTAQTKGEQDTVEKSIRARAQRRRQRHDIPDTQTIGGPSTVRGNGDEPFHDLTSSSAPGQEPYHHDHAQAIIDGGSDTPLGELQAHSQDFIQELEGSQVRIVFMERENNKRTDELLVDVSSGVDRATVVDTAAKYMQQGRTLMDIQGRVLVARTCLDHVVADKTNTIYLSRKRQVETAMDTVTIRDAKLDNAENRKKRQRIDLYSG
ncbi:hypothetical protein F4821DRAFT_264558 [Hypoxylon rubiginosum]|uniref:Uncharacterized protein n=1 Tax=Hypoxylon rubiginosum TaxID=110542 RepID=A0ACC0CN33_9PEZI|nr:hypothetical protein F4821DRAFT_264558 [Hypoxylon rubiginosum]